MEITRLVDKWMNAEVSKVIYNYAGNDGFDKSIYEMDNGTFMLAEPPCPGELRGRFSQVLMASLSTQGMLLA